MNKLCRSAYVSNKQQHFNFFLEVFVPLPYQQSHFKHSLGRVVSLVGKDQNLDVNEFFRRVVFEMRFARPRQKSKWLNYHIWIRDY